MERRLTLRTEPLAELTTDELAGVAGGRPTVAQACDALSLDDACGFVTCGLYCTGISDPTRKQVSP